MSNVLKVSCPCCQAILTVDPETGTVLSHEEYKKPQKSLEDFLSDQKGRSQSLEEKFKSGQEKQKNKMDLLEKKFKHAVDNKDNLPDPPPSVMWD